MNPCNYTITVLTNDDAEYTGYVLYTQYDNGLWNPIEYVGGPQVFTATEPIGEEKDVSDEFLETLELCLESEDYEQELQSCSLPEYECWAIDSLAFCKHTEGVSVNREEQFIMNIATGDETCSTPEQTSVDIEDITGYNVYTRTSPLDGDDDVSKENPAHASLFTEWADGFETLLIANPYQNRGRYSAYTYEGCNKKEPSSVFFDNVSRNLAELRYDNTTFKYDWHVFMQDAPVYEHMLMSPLAYVMSGYWIPDEILELVKRNVQDYEPRR